MASPFIRVDAEGRILGDFEGKFSSEFANYLNTIRNGTINSAASAPSTIADEPGGQNVAVGGSISGVIDVNGDFDYYSVNLTAGQRTYSAPRNGRDSD